MAYIYQLPSGRWRAQVRAKGVKTSDSFLTETQARNWAKAREDEIERGVHGNGADSTLGDLLRVYLPVAQDTDSGKWNALRINNWMRDPLAERRLDAIVTHDVNEWIARRRKLVKDATVNRELNLMSAAFNYAVKAKKWIASNPVHGANRPPRGKARNRPRLTPEEILALRIATGVDADPGLKTLTARVGATFLLALETGARSGELLRVKPEHYRRSVHTLHIAAQEAGGRKSSRSGRASVDPSRNVPLTPRAMELLDRLVATMPPDQPYVIGLTDSQRDALWRKARNQSGVRELTFHDLKHEAASRMAKHIDVLALSHAIGTKDVRLLRDTYYINDASAVAQQLPEALAPEGKFSAAPAMRPR